MLDFRNAANAAEIAAPEINKLGNEVAAEESPARRSSAARGGNDPGSGIILITATAHVSSQPSPQLNAMVFQAHDEARAQAAAKLSGAFAGVPMLLIDILGDKKGWQTRSG